MSSGENLSSGCLLYADPLGPPTSNQNSGGTQLSTEEPIGLDKTVKKSVEQDECKQTVGTDAMANVYPGPSVIELNEDTDADKVCDSFVSKLQSTNCEESLVTDKTIDFQTMDTTASPPLTEESGNPDRMTYSRQDYPAVECPNPGDLHLVPDGCFADINSGPYVNSPPMYYIPQVVTYFPTPVKYPKETEEIDETQMNSDSYACTDGTNSKSVPHYHAGIILPRMESTGVAEMNHYVGVPCPDVQYAYSNYPCGLMDSTESIPYPPSMYCYSPDPGYLIYTNPVVQNSPTLILAYPM
ncbi:unnamed protein product [Echinostoma caproni]|uniref:Early flowering 3 n=1 Tax=Echinostoma caproni TaxID=27848 RepID=A0A183A6J0_9TREM|nr:unnamed protein product [Echinostoma caproni]